MFRSLVRKGHSATWGMVSGWLHPDPNKRTEPKLNIGLAILEIYKTELKTNKKNRSA